MEKIVVHWFRRDLRLHDNTALFNALQSGKRVLLLFIFDEHILSELRTNAPQLTLDKRLIFIHSQIQQLQSDLQQYHSGILIKQGISENVFQELQKEYAIEAVYSNHDYEPYAIQRDQQIKNILAAKNIPFYTFKDQVIFEKGEVVKDDGLPYTVYTPYAKKWKSVLTSDNLRSQNSENNLNKLFNLSAGMVSLEEIGFQNTIIDFPSPKAEDVLLKQYENTRDYPSILGTSRLSVHLRFGTISIRQLVQQAIQANADKYLNELIWREFYMQILFHFPNVVHESFKPKYDAIQWRNNEAEFEAWCSGNTGYPIVDAGMRELNATGFMHNRVRMIVASFLTKHLLIDWRKGEAYFASKLLDYELSSNNGGWQWAAGCGVDAAPYFRVFNPYIQTKKFDANAEYINHWIPEINELNYPQPIVNHDEARKRCLEVYKIALQ